MTRTDDHGTGEAPSASDGDARASPRGDDDGGVGGRPEERGGRPGPDAGPSGGSDAGGVTGPSAARDDLPADRLEHVIRRAAELQHSAGDESPDALSGDEVLRIGREVGLEPRHVRRALAEQRAESLLPEMPEDEALLRTLGSGLVRASRAVPGDRAEVQEKVEEHFRTRESLRAVRQRRGRSLWEPAEGLMSKMQRAMDVGGRGYELAEAKSVELSVSDLEEGWSLVALTVDARNVRSQHAVSWLAGSAPGWLVAALTFELALGVPWLVTGPLAGAGVLGTGAMGGRWSFEKKRRRMELVVSGLLDRLEQGAELEPDRPPGWRERLMAGGHDR